VSALPAVSSYEIGTASLLRLTARWYRQHIREARRHDLGPAELAAIEHAIRVVAWRQLAYDRRCDLRQELALSVLEDGIPQGANVEAWITRCAKNWIAGDNRLAARRRRLLRDTKRGGYRKGPAWRPSWYPPHPDATEHNPLACSGARVMACKGSPIGAAPERDEQPSLRVRREHLPNVEGATIDVVDSRRLSSFCQQHPIRASSLGKGNASSF
jgi:hypothetical protein